MTSQIELLLIVGMILTIVMVMISMYSAYKNIKRGKHGYCDGYSKNINFDRALIALSEYAKTHNVNKSDYATTFGNILRSERQELLYTFINENNRIPPSISSAALKELLLFTEKKHPDYIIGINKGGVMVGAIASLRLNLPNSHLVRCYVDNGVIECHPEELNGSVLVIDDISRTGNTLVRIKNYLLQNSTNIDKIITATLFMYMENDKPIYRDIDYFSYKINRQSVMLPWNNIGTTKEEQFHEIENRSMAELASQLEIKMSH